MADSQYFGLESFFNEDVTFYKNVNVRGIATFNFPRDVTFTNIIVRGTSQFYDTSNFYGFSGFYQDVYFDKSISADKITARTELDVGVNGTTLLANAQTSSVGIGSQLPQQRLDVAGSIKIDDFIYDSVNSPGISGYYLNMDAGGVRWIPATPNFTQGIFIQDEGVYIPIAGAAKSFTALNFKQINSLGIGTDGVIPIPNPANPNFIADIQTKDFWGFVPGSDDIYRLSKVGINSNSPSTTLDISGTLHSTGATKFDSTLVVSGITSLGSNLNVTGPTALASNLDVTGVTNLNSTLGVTGATSLGANLSVTGATLLNSTLGVTGATSLNSSLNVTGIASLSSTLGVTGATSLNSSLNVAGQTLLNSTLGVNGATNLNSTLDVTGATNLSSTLGVSGPTSLNSTLQVGTAGTIITTTIAGLVGIGTNIPSKPVDVSQDLIIRKRLYDYNSNVGYDTNFYQVPRAVLTQVGVGTTGQIIGGRFFDAANLIRLNLDFIAAEAIGFITSTDYKNPAFVVPGVGGVSTCRSDITKILKAITIDITKGGNSQSVGAGLSYYNGNSLIHITGNDVNGYSIKDATIVAITSAAQIARYVINNVVLPKSYQSGVSSIRQIRDLTIQNDSAVGFNTSLSGCANVTSAIFTCAGIVTTIINGGPSAAPNITYPDGRIIWAPAGADSRNLIWVSKYGNDDNSGSTEGDAKLTIAAAAAIAQPGDTIMVRSGVYYENNPVGLRTDVSVSGQDLRLVTVIPKNLNKDVFHVRRGCLIENMNFACDTGQSNSGGGAVAFPPSDSTKAAVSGYTAPGPATEGSSGRWRSPYIRNCTNFMPLSIGMRINGNDATASTIGADLKSMVCDSFTQYNEAGIGVSITNNGYAQLVSIFTINCDKAIYCDTGGQCDLTNSNSSFGNYGLYAVGLGSTEFTGKVNTATSAETDTIIFDTVKDGGGNVRRPYDGQAIYFKINLANYNTGQTGILTAPLQSLKSINIINGGSGYSQTVPPIITIYDANTNSDQPLGPEGIVAELSPTISDAGVITAVDIVNSGRNYLPSQNIKVRIDGVATNNLTATMQPIYYTISQATLPTNVTGITTVTLNEFVPYLLYANDPVEMKRISRILTSGHSFEYIGTGTDINTSTPLKGAVPIKDNEIVALDGAQIPYTSTDQKGNFNIGEGIQVNQTTATITGRDFSKAIQAQVTPLILALR